MSVSDPVDRVFEGGCGALVFGLGYVGLALVAAYLRKGLRVYGVDKNLDKIKALHLRSFRFLERNIEEAIYNGLEKGMLKLTTDSLEFSESACVKVITVPVYLDWLTKEIDYSSLVEVGESVGSGLKKKDLVILESSVPPGTTEGVLKPVLERVSGLVAGRDFYLAYSPERIYVGHSLEDIEVNYPKIVSGINEVSAELAAKFYSRISSKGVIRLSSIKAAEFSKLAEGVYRDVNIALSNELAMLSEVLGVNYYEVREAANSQPYCHLHLPGPGVGGPCIPIYPYFIINIATRRGFIPQLLLLARNINEFMPYEIVKRFEKFLRTHGVKVSSSRIGVLGVAFRGDTDDTRLSPTHDIIALLRARGCRNIVAHDPLVIKDEVLDQLGVPLTQDLRVALEDRDAIIVLTKHTEYSKLTTGDIMRLSKNPDILIYDSVNVITNNNNYTRIEKLGITT
ncbi:MAG: nucleotide sugar dehydrogenase [Zestosphaera sp.]